MRKLDASLHGITQRQICRVAPLGSLMQEWEPDLNFLVPTLDQNALRHLEKLKEAGLNNLVASIPDEFNFYPQNVPFIKGSYHQLETDDVVVLAPQVAHVLYRHSDQHHVLFLTNRCNSYCLMCSQPPTRHDDSWLIDEALQVIKHIKTSPAIMGISGGEPLLTGSGLRHVIDTFQTLHPHTHLEILSNGRLLSNPILAERLLQGLKGNVRWLVPLYGHADFAHDFVVQSPGAFEQTIAGLLSLQDFGQSVQLRIVLIEPVLKLLPGLCEFIARSLPFINQVAIMGCEPIGFALANRELCEIDLRDWHKEIIAGTTALRRGRIPYVLMNSPLCSLPKNLWSDAHRSISDWKQTYASECYKCAVKSSCSGLFAWHERGWKPTAIKAISKGVLHE